MRSLLTALGIVIGVAAVVVMQSMGEGATAYVSQQIAGLGSNMLILMPGSPRVHGMEGMMGVPLFTNMDIDVLRHHAHSVKHIALVNARPLRSVYAQNNHTCSVQGLTPEYFLIRPWPVSAGRGLSPEENRDGSLVCLLGKTVKENLFGEQDAVGKEIRIHNLPCRVVGVLESRGTSAFGVDQDDLIILPFTTIQRRIVGNDRVAFVFLSAVSADRTDEAKEEVNKIMRERRHILPGEDDDFVIRDPRELEAVLQSVTGVLTVLLSGVAAISLIVGGIGIMNIMLVSVTERTREIGVRLAVGARGSDILTQFLVEASFLSVIGGLIGLLLGLAGAYGATRAISIPYVIPFSTIPVAVGVSLVVGVIFGVFPARKAARLNPLDALRFE